MLPPPLDLAADWAAPFVGLPFVDHGRTRAGVDCYGLVMLAYEEAAGVALPIEPYSSAADPAAAADAWKEAQSTWAPVEAPSAGDLVVMRIGRWVCHVGLYVEPDRVLHVRKATRSIVQRLDDAPPAVGFFRYQP